LYYKVQAAGGPGLIIVEGTAVDIHARGSSHGLSLYHESQVDSFNRLAINIKSENCIAYLQVMHAGPQISPSLPNADIVSASGLPCVSIGSKPETLTTAAVIRIEDAFVRTIELAWESGFDGIELHLAHGYLLHDFISPRTNMRSDIYGGTSYNARFNIIRNIIGKVRRSCDIDIGIRISGDDFCDDGIHPDSAPEIIECIEQLRPTYAHVTAGIYDTSNLKHLHMQKGYFFELASLYKSQTEIPIIGVGKVLDLAQAEDHLTSRHCDLVAIGRAQLADPCLVLKALTEKDAPNLCIQCRQCMYLKYGRSELSCPVRQLSDRASV